jgi:hypothetical protein
MLRAKRRRAAIADAKASASQPIGRRAIAVLFIAKVYGAKSASITGSTAEAAPHTLLIEMDTRATPCARCQQATALAELAVWTERQRLRIFCSEAMAFKYVERLRYWALCPTCVVKLEQGAGVGDIEHRRAVVSLVAIAVASGIVAIALPAIMPTLLSAFWQTH